jgi:glycosyltransferase involved in cell wall biosynthesis
MARQMRELLPEHPHVIIGRRPIERAAYAYAEEVVEVAPDGLFFTWLALRRRLRGRWIALAPFVWAGHGALRWAPWLLAPRKLLAFNAQLERHHLRLTCPVASWRFLRGESAGDIFRPTVLAPLRRLPSLISRLLFRLFARREAVTPLAAASTAQPGITVIDRAAFWADPDRLVAEAPNELIAVGRDPRRLLRALDDPQVWLAYEGDKVSLAAGAPAPGPVKEGEDCTWALCHCPTAMLFRRDTYLALGGGGLLDLSLRAWRKGLQSIFTGGSPAESVPRSRYHTALGSRPAALLEPGVHAFRGRPERPGRLRVAVASPYLPFPLSHGGAIRIYNLLREAAAGADISLLAFAEKETGREVEPLREFCSRIVLVQTPRWDPPAVLRILPNGVARFRSRAMEAALAETHAAITQVEYTQLAHLRRAAPGRRLLVEHDLTFDLHRQLRRRAHGWSKLHRTLEAARWRRYELGHARAYDRIIAMSPDDLERLAAARVDRARLRVVENGVDLARFHPCPPVLGRPPELLFIGSFRHFPNLLGYQFLIDRIWTTLRRACPELKLTVVAGADPAYYWQRHTGAALPPSPPGVELFDFVEDVRPLYARATIVVVPLLVSAGTNLKVLEALAMERPLVSTAVGVAGLGLTPGEHCLLADQPTAFAAAVLSLLWNPRAREDLAAAGRAVVEERYGWDALGRKLLGVWEELARESGLAAGRAAVV